jgi:sialic acid synthase SpsE
VGTTINIRGRLIGPGQSVYIIAEMSADHNQDFDQAVKIIYLPRPSRRDELA